MALSLAIKESKITITNTIQMMLWLQPSRILRQYFSNLFTNAIKYKTPKRNANY
jgi:signal transduction histidine kinase